MKNSTRVLAAGVAVWSLAGAAGGVVTGIEGLARVRALSAAQPESAPPVERTPERRGSFVVAERMPVPVRAQSGSSDPTLISVPGNTLGPGEPLWVRSDRAAAAARLERAEAELVEREAARASHDRRGNSGRVIIYGGHTGGHFGGRRVIGEGFAHSWVRGEEDDHKGGLVRRVYGPGSVSEPDAFDQGQLEFGRNARPQIAPGIEAQLEAQRRFGENARPPVVKIQEGVDEGQRRIRRGAEKPQ